MEAEAFKAAIKKQKKVRAKCKKFIQYLVVFYISNTLSGGEAGDKVVFPIMSLSHYIRVYTDLLARDYNMLRSELKKLEEDEYHEILDIAEASKYMPIIKRFGDGDEDTMALFDDMLIDFLAGKDYKVKRKI